MNMRAVGNAVIMFILAAVAVSAAEPTLKLLIDDKVISSNLVVINGRSYIAVDELAKGLAATTTVTRQPGKPTTIDLALPKEATKAERSYSVGSVSGIVTYYFNENYGSKSDVGADVLLLMGQVTVDETDSFIVERDEASIVKTEANSSAADEVKNATKVKIVARTTVDGSGRFELKDVPTGSYTLVIRSKHRRDLTQRDIVGVVGIRTVEVEAGRTADASKDFPVTRL